MLMKKEEDDMQDKDILEGLVAIEVLPNGYKWMLWRRISFLQILQYNLQPSIASSLYGICWIDTWKGEKRTITFDQKLYEGKRTQFYSPVEDHTKELPIYCIVKGGGIELHLLYLCTFYKSLIQPTL